jgi:thymidylate synthase ThyX
MENKKNPRYIRGKYSEGQKEATAKYNAKAYDQIPIRVMKGRKTDIQAHAEEMCESLNGFINRAINEAIERDNKHKSHKNCKTIPEVMKMPKDSQIDPKEVRKTKAKGQTPFASDKATTGDNNNKKQSGSRHKPGSDK